MQLELTPAVAARLLLTAKRNVMMRHAGDVAGHEFHGNQWTGNVVRATERITGRGVEVQEAQTDPSGKVMKYWGFVDGQMLRKSNGVGITFATPASAHAAARKSLRSASRNTDNTSLHKAADAHLQILTLALRAAFNVARKALKGNLTETLGRSAKFTQHEVKALAPSVDASVKALHAALLKVLPPVLAKVYVAGGNVAIGMLPKRRAAAYNEDEERDDHGRWTGTGSNPEQIAAIIAHEPLANPERPAGGLPRTRETKKALDEAGTGATFTGNGKVSVVDISSLKPVEHDQMNPTEHFVERYRKGWPVQPPVVDQKGNVLDGHHRIASALAAGRTKIYVITVHTTRHLEAYAAFRALKPQPKRRAAEGLSSGRMQRMLAEDDSPFGIRFDVTDPAAIKWAREHTSKIADDISQTSKDRINEAIAQALEGDGLDAAYDDILDAVGDEARADMIARTETMWAASEGQQAGWDEAVDAGLLPENAQVEWIATSDCCDICEALDGTTRPIDGEYDDPEGADGPPQHPNCRCTEGIAG